jgi:hypothetical protein
MAQVIRDKRVLHLIGRYLRRGAMGDGMVEASVEGTPQGGPLSPCWRTCIWMHWTRNWREGGTGSAVMPMTVRHERKGPKGPNVCNCSIDEGRPLGTGLQEQVPNHLWRLWSKAMVVSAEGKGLGRTRSGA